MRKPATKRQRNKRRTKTKKLRQRQRQKGGKFYGKGTYGVVLGDPRIPCEDEDYEADKIGEKDEISKVIFDDSELEKINNSIELIKARFKNPAAINKYIIVPSRVCNLNKEQMKKHSNVYTKEWSNNTTFYGYDIQAISLKGKHDLNYEISNIRTLDDVGNFAKGLINVIKGLALLHDKSIVHGDIKLGNIVAMNSTDFRIIDTDEIKPFDKLDEINTEFFYKNFMYVIWPIATVFTVKPAPSLTKIYNTISANITSEFNKGNKDVLETSYSTLFNDVKSLRPKFAETLISEKDPNNTDVIKRIHALSEPNRLYPYIDRYSFGIILMELLKIYSRLPNTTVDDPFGEEMLNIVEKCCFVEHGFKTTTHEIATMYEDFITALF